VSGQGTRERLSYKFVQQTAQFQAQVYVIKVYAIDHVHKDYEHRYI